MQKPIVLHILSCDLWAGAESQVLAQVCSLKESEFEPAVLVFNEAQALSRFRCFGISVEIAKESDGIISLVNNCLRIAARLNPSIVVAHGYKESLVGLFIRWYLGAKLITWHHGAPENHRGWHKVKRKVTHSLHSCIARFFAARVVTVSASLARELGFGQWAKLRVIWNTLPLEIPTEPAECQQDSAGDPSLCRDRLSLIWVGRLVSVKRLDVALGALAALAPQKRPQLLVAGSGPEELHLKNLSQQLGLQPHVKFLGFVTAVRSLIADSDALLITSDREGLPTVVIEAMVQSKPIISTELAGVREVIDHFPDYPIKFAPLGDVSAIAQAMEEVIDETKPSSSISQETAKMIGYGFSMERLLKDQVALYSSLSVGSIPLKSKGGS